MPLTPLEGRARGTRYMPLYAADDLPHSQAVASSLFSRAALFLLAPVAQAVQALRAHIADCAAHAVAAARAAVAQEVAIAVFAQATSLDCLRYRRCEKKSRASVYN